MQLCDRQLLKRGLDGKTQNSNEAFSGLISGYIPKETFVEFNTLELGVNMAFIQFNKGFNGFRALLAELSISVGENTAIGFTAFDKERVNESRRHSLTCHKVARKKNKWAKKSKITHEEMKEGVMYKCGEF
ncbi:hypothetical protein AVEN_245861-1 [Araneus ventricosus]|uniref:Uncharacterized protein n=1 Tax=Araneus ventricosus TaxID=182803 RepID=A0A4Y2MBN5_ARAVE|nr:hypothetical protein AVEN_245861-1 [Araneus ventricosus]